MSLAKEKCTPCSSGEGRLSGADALRLVGELNDWTFYPERIEKRHEFKNFNDALKFVNKVGAVAESEGHHPDIHLGWGYVELVIYTHKVGGLTLNDFILAAKIDAIG